MKETPEESRRRGVVLKNGPHKWTPRDLQSFILIDEITTTIWLRQMFRSNIFSMRFADILIFALLRLSYGLAIDDCDKTFDYDVLEYIDPLIGSAKEGTI